MVTCQPAILRKYFFPDHIHWASLSIRPKNVLGFTRRYAHGIKDYFFHIFEALVNTENELAQATLSNFEVRLGGHHEFVTYQQLVKNDNYFDYILKKNNEYFEPILFEANNSGRRTVIVTSAGLDNGSTRYRAIHLADSLRNKGISTTLIHASTPPQQAEPLIQQATLLKTLS